MRRLLRFTLPLTLPLTLFSLVSDAQVVRRGSLADAPSTWVSGGAAVQQGWTVTDGTTGSTWQFGTTTMYGASIEKAITGATIGLRGSTALAPLRYTSGATGAGGDADARVSQLFLSAHVAGDRGFHSVLELDAGATLYSNFRSRATGQQLAPSSDADVSLALGYGVGYGFSNRFAVEVVRDLTEVLHQRTGLPADAESSVRLSSTRIVGRFGLGQR